MPQRPNRPCRHRGCNAIHRNANGYCDQHQEQAQQAKRGSAGQFSAWYTTTKWRALRKRQLTAEPLCAYCMRRGRVEEAVVCDHITPHRGDPEMFWAGPFQSLCLSCHSGEKQREERAAKGKP